ncbi:altronate dehydratase family protein [Algoriphagus marincola]|uniref:Altronate dehydratase family protein n=1 Tax=Algoriphagus marincola TaxID=264027 RepID=A0ABS7N8J4_9BACT|nr:altronate dehydratase family protein [Algoriphagus marincola]MBY5952651.1 altronate dehydratase family protein [Algoriphagus marincola]
MEKQFLQIDPADNVLVALQNLEKGAEILHDGNIIHLEEEIPAKHKFAIHPFEPGDEVKMYGVLVGKAVKSIPKGGLLTTENIKHEASSFTHRSAHYQWNAPDVSKFAERTFDGFHRADGQVGTANFWLVIPLVFCENRNVEVIKDAFLEELGYAKPNPYKGLVKNLINQYESKKPTASESNTQTASSRTFPQVDGIKFLTHQGGCGGTRQDAEALCALLAGYIHHPNVAGATVLSLGCQHAQAAILKGKLYEFNPAFDKPLLVFEQQQEGTEPALLSKAIEATFWGMAEANKLSRKPAPLSKLSIGLECGGSDGFSGISANPVLGRVSDLIVALGGKAILSEFPELCGVEQNLIDRCVNDQTAERFSSLMKAYSQAAEKVGSGFDMNPSPGNIRDGLITDAIKSCGAAKKGGNSPVTDVLDYGEYVQKPGLNLLCTPGNDVESTTALAGAGANLILFTTGLGTPTGNPICPVLKVSSNDQLAQRMPDIIDFNTGGVITGEKAIEQLGEELLEEIIAIASGKKLTKAMMLNQDDFIPWKRGVSL